MSANKVEIIYADDDIIVVNKPTGVSATKDRSGLPQLIDLLNEQLSPQPTKLRLVHRLDKDTSGVMLLARSKKAQTLLAGYFQDRKVRKTYLTLIRGKVADRQGTINAPLSRNPRNTEFMRIDFSSRGKESITDWRLLADFGDIALLAVHPLTGRTHQIRVHLPGTGLPLAIDPLYGTGLPLYLSDFKPNYRLAKGKTERPLIDRLTLHAYQLELPDQKGRRPNIFIAPLDKKLKAVLKMLTKHNPAGPAAFTNPDDFTAIIEARMLEIQFNAHLL